MIHEAARRCVGWIDGSGRGLVGHAVLIGRSHAVTCAHVLTCSSERPVAPVVLCFPNLGGLRVEATVPDWGWAPYDPHLSQGSDIAVLELLDASGVRNDVWARWGQQRPAHKAAVVTLEFLTARPDGDPREGQVVDGSGHIISLEGAHFVTPGVSGSGLFPKEPGERLLGLISGRPLDPNHQTQGYAIPADAVAAIMARAPQIGATEAMRPAIETLISIALAVVGGNLLPLLEAFAENARKVLRRPAETWREEDVQALAVLQLELDEARAGPSGDADATPSGFHAAARWLARVLCQIAASGPDPGTPVSLDSQMADLLRQGLQEIEKMLGAGPCPETARQALAQLRDTILAALARDKVRLGQLSAQVDLARRRSEETFTTGARALMACIGQRPALAPPRAMFVERTEVFVPEMVVIPAGGFLMGAPEAEKGTKDDERPQRRVTVPRPFALGRVAVTFAMWDAAVAAGFQPDEGAARPEDQGWGREQWPVINISWHDAHAYCAWLNRRLDLPAGTYRLPSEAEWEYACRAGKVTPFSFSGTISATQANYDARKVYGAGQKGEYRERTVPVGSLPANPWGLHEMHGNVWEWVEDAYGPYPAGETDSRPLVHADSGARVVRGGSWNNIPRYLRSARRIRGQAGSRIGSIGFRLARTPGG